MKKIFNVLVVLCAVFAVCALMSCKQPTGPATVSEWKSAPTTASGGETYYYLTAYDDETWDMSITTTVTGGPSVTQDFSKGTYTGDIGADTSPTNEVKVTITHTWNPVSEDWDAIPSPTPVVAEIKSGKLNVAGFLVEFTKQ